jgi:hypothetical protein
LLKSCETLLQSGRVDTAYETMRPYTAEPPFRLSIRDAIVAAVQKIVEIERERGEIARTERSALAPAAQAVPTTSGVGRTAGALGLSILVPKRLHHRHTRAA